VMTFTCQAFFRRGVAPIKSRGRMVAEMVLRPCDFVNEVFSIFGMISSLVGVVIVIEFIGKLSMLYKPEMTQPYFRNKSGLCQTSIKFYG
ncbi:MAG TPA: hypothetical protein DD729_03615, partial [Rhodobacteraceae bacterium]|nr:hypothetical protein [Paracoccaceae bacterium]